jgi:hypothetical protein
MDCFERAAREKMQSVEAEGSGPKMLVIKLQMPMKHASSMGSRGSMGSMESEDVYGSESDMSSEDQMSSQKARALFDIVNEVVGMKHAWTPDIEKKLMEKLSSMHNVTDMAEEED